MLPHDKALALTASETERLRDLRSRLNRATPKTAGPLMAGLFKLAEGAGLAPAIADDRALDALRAEYGGAPDWIARVADAADIRRLRLLVAALHRWKQANAPEYLTAVSAGAPQAVLSRRLALAGREPAKVSDPLCP